MTYDEFLEKTGPGSEFSKQLKEAAFSGRLEQFKEDLELKALFLDYPVKVMETEQAIDLKEIAGLVEPQTLALLAMVNNTTSVRKGFGLRVTGYGKVERLNPDTKEMELVSARFEREITI